MRYFCVLLYTQFDVDTVYTHKKTWIEWKFSTHVLAIDITLP